MSNDDDDDGDYDDEYDADHDDEKYHKNMTSELQVLSSIWSVYSKAIQTRQDSPFDILCQCQCVG